MKWAMVTTECGKKRIRCRNIYFPGANWRQMLMPVPHHHMPFVNGIRIGINDFKTGFDVGLQRPRVAAGYFGEDKIKLFTIHFLVVPVQLLNNSLSAVQFIYADLSHAV